jgi:hypothetical protein
MLFSLIRIHRNEYVDCVFYFDLNFFKKYSWAIKRLGSLNAENLLSHNTQHLRINLIKLIKAAPRPSGGKPFKKFPHRPIVQPF